MKTKILHVYNNLDIVNGITSQAIPFINGINKTDQFEILLLLGKMPETKLKDFKNIIIDKTFNYSERSFFTFLKTFTRAYKLIKKENIKIIHTHHFYHSFIFYLLKIFFRIKVILSVHGLIPQKGILPHFLADKIILVSKGNYDRLIKLKPKLKNKITIIHHYYDIKSKTRNKNKIKFLIATRLVEDKGINILIEALKIIKNKKLDITIAGEGELSELVIQSSKELGFKFVGVIKNIESKIKEYDVLINPIISKIEVEGFPTILVLAGLNNLAVVTSDFYGYNYYLNNENSFIYKKDSAKELAQTLIKVSKNKKLLQNKSLKLNSDFKNIFNKNNLVELINFYKSLSK